MTEELLNLIIGILCVLESGGNPDAVGDGGKAIGILQIHKTMVEEVNRIEGREKYNLLMRRSPLKSMEMARIYLRHYEKYPDGGVPDQWYVEYCARIWNGGPDGYNEKETVKYGRAAVAMYKEYKKWKEQK